MNTNILDFGAKPDGKTLCTKEIQAAIDACASSGGGRVTVPAGNYVSGTIWLKSNVELHLEHNSVIRGSDDLDDYNAEDAYSQNFSSRNNEKWLGKHLVVAHECENVAITGGGTLDGNAEVFLGDVKPYSAYCWRDGLRTAKDLVICRPGQLVCFIECKNVRVENITLTNQPCWGCFLHGCERVIHIFDILTWRIMLSPTPILNTLDDEPRMQLVTVICSHGFCLSDRRNAEPRIAMASSPVSIMQSLTVT